MFDCTVPNNTLSRAELSYDEGTVLNVHYGDVLIKYGSVLDVQKDDIPRIPYRCREDFNGALLQDGDVIIADTAEDETTGKACEIGNLQGRAIVSGLHTMVCRPRHRMALGYLGHYLNSNAYHHQLLPLMQGIKVLSLSRSNIQKTSVSYPTVEKEQQLIANYFSQLDNLITLHQREFAFLCKEKSKKFRYIKNAWEQRKWCDTVDISTEMVDPTSGEYDDMPHIAPGNIESFTGRILDNVKSVKEEQLISGKFRFRPGDVVYGKINPQLGKYFYASVDGLTSADAYVFNGKNGVTQKFLFSLLQTEDFFKYSVSVSKRSGMPKINRDELNAYGFLAPKEEEQEQIGSFLLEIDNLITLHQRKPNFYTGGYYAE